MLYLDCVGIPFFFSDEQMSFKGRIGRLLIWRLRQIREWIRNTRDWRSRAGIDYMRIREEVSPIFVIGANRSGTSVVAYLLSQHPEVEGLFDGGIDPRYNDAGHSFAFCESGHIWRQLMANSEARQLRGHLPFWAHPAYIGLNYRDHAFSNNERRLLAWQVEQYRRTDKSPLLKNNINTLRVGLITDVFPLARFVLVCRSWENYVSRSIHKWATDGSGTLFDWPITGLHWHMANLVARYDLEIYAPQQYMIVWLDELIAGMLQAKQVFAAITANLCLLPYEFDLSALNRHWKESASISDFENISLKDVSEIVESERQILHEIYSHIVDER